jgi:crotonobetainyl-CoA:carnitine CoA-transferase CaiB-like acyl-CoA transferase
MFCTMILGDLGADVLMLERPMTGSRVAYERVVNHIDSPEDEQRHAAHNALRRNKRSIGLNLKEPEALEIFYHLVRDADVVVEGFRPGVMDRLRAGYQKVREINPRVVYCSISGYGQDGPYKSLAGHDINYISLAGALGMIGRSEEEEPAIPLNLVADYAGGGWCSAVAVLAALMARDRTGKGQYLDIAMTEGVLYMLEGVISNLFAWGRAPQRGRSMLNGAAPYYNVYETSDGKYLSVAAIEPWFWENLCRTMGRDELVPEQRARGRRRQEIRDFLKETFRTRTRDEWFDLLRDQDICVGKVYSMEEALADPQVAHRGMVVEVETPGLPEGKVSQVGIPMHLSETPGRVRYAGSVTGRHTEEVLLGMGYAQEQVEDLRSREVVQ